jgi:hypothetical protein
MDDQLDTLVPCTIAELERADGDESEASRILFKLYEEIKRYCSSIVEIVSSVTVLPRTYIFVIALGRLILSEINTLQKREIMRRQRARTETAR